MTATLCAVEDTATSHEPPRRPGEPLVSGFTPGENRRGARLSAAAQTRVLNKMRSVDEARMRAAKDSRTSYVG